MLWLLLLLLAAAPAASVPEQKPRRLPAVQTTATATLAAGEAHRYAIEQRGVWVTVVQDGLDVALSALGADGELLFSVDNPGDRWGEEWLLLEDTTDAHLLEVRPLAAADHGRYRLRVEPREPPGSAVLQRAAERAVTEAGRLFRSGERAAKRRALEAYRVALEAWTQLGQNREATRTLFLLAMLHRQLDQPSEALPYLRRALAGWQRLGDRRAEAQTRMEVASTTWLLGEEPSPERLYLDALEIWREVDDLRGQALTLNYVGLARARPAPRTALGPYAEALRLFRQSGDLLWQGTVLNNIGGIHDLTGEPGLALEHFHRAIDIYRRLGQP
ncbi:MAG: tetratricopeptide repeat protein, partial [Holophagales bacterium]|nr:tetratricopeptide repeat protein [Holophagales bacterium]